MNRPVLPQGAWMAHEFTGGGFWDSQCKFCLAREYRTAKYGQKICPMLDPELNGQTRPSRFACVHCETPLMPATQPFSRTECWTCVGNGRELEVGAEMEAECRTPGGGIGNTDRTTDYGRGEPIGLPPSIQEDT